MDFCIREEGLFAEAFLLAAHSATHFGHLTSLDSHNSPVSLAHPRLKMRKLRFEGSRSAVMCWKPAGLAVDNATPPSTRCDARLPNC